MVGLMIEVPSIADFAMFQFAGPGLGQPLDPRREDLVVQQQHQSRMGPGQTAAAVANGALCRRRSRTGRRTGIARTPAARDNADAGFFPMHCSGTIARRAVTRSPSAGIRTGATHGVLRPTFGIRSGTRNPCTRSRGPARSRHDPGRPHNLPSAGTAGSADIPASARLP